MQFYPSIMTQAKHTLSAPAFKKIISGRKSYVPERVVKKMKAAGLSGLLYKKNVSRQEALKAINFLQTEGEIAKTSPSALFSHASLAQQAQEAASGGEKIKRYARAYIAQDISDQLATEEAERREKVTGFKAKKYFGKLSDEMAEEQQRRERKIAAERGARQKLSDQSVVNKTQPRPINIEPPDIFSGL